MCPFKNEHIGQKQAINVRKVGPFWTKIKKVNKTARMDAPQAQNRARSLQNGILGNSPLARPMNSHADHYLQATLSAAGLVVRKAFMSRIGGCPNIRLYSRLNWLTLSYPTSNAAPVASNPSMSIRCLAV
jgi:hypothetical protein